MTQERNAVAAKSGVAINLSEFGLVESDIDEIHSLALTIKSNDPMSVAEFGRDADLQSGSFSDELLSQVRNKDLDDAGEKLGEVLAVARSVNMNALTDRRSKLPLIGPLIDKVTLRSTKVLSQFDTTRETIEKLVSEVSTTQEGMVERNRTLEETFNSVRSEHRALGLHIAAGKLRLIELRAEADALRSEFDGGPSKAQELADLNTLIATLDKRVGDLLASQQNAYQTLPAIRMVQGNNLSLVDKFHSIRSVTIPAWKRSFMLSLALNEQRNAVELAGNIDDTTNNLLKSNAKLLYQNSVDTARANQRAVIDVSTLEEVQGTLIKTLEDVSQIHREGVQIRKDAEKRILSMQSNLDRRLAQGNQQEALH
ncbi:toxic anion resistance protein [Pseudomonas sp. PS02290]|uniref:toxic anion resistance protein n=1 Tax=Pseudomonas sp. PS02290 TaxID=2991430 RepID=UPI001A17CE79|nr:toxic anion resistance protein [Pseudomonas sp. PS02290]MBF9243227.1 toxic anion resistance protein [Pseudomonas syringae pv. tomato]MBW8023692.1 toxic anion resistance protein [Pseudomonas syringae pv. tomato]